MVARRADRRAAQVAAAGVIEKRYGEIVMRQTYVTMLPESTDKAPILIMVRDHSLALESLLVH